MTDQARPPRAADARPTAELIAVALSSDYEDHARWDAMSTIHFRGGPEELAAGLHLCQSPLAAERRLGVEILAQLGGGERRFIDETLPALIERLADPDEVVIADAAIALGHRADPRAIPHLVALSPHPSAAIRHGVIFGLLAQSDPAAVAALIALSTDEDDHNRDWATFGLGRQIDVDTPELRAALLARLEDSDRDTRDEAIIGLARRGDRRVAPAIQRGLASESNGDWPLEAATLLADPALHPHLRALYDRISDEDRSSFADEFAAALAACQPRPEAS